ncbi:hypothetical protein PHYBOEH_001454 [Phytophthora boehmeriae]|uniref:PX domain-containing protein n=1 Tax=Phytophthora boehmeriae TaxID=109152 RepID=A0A8T1WW84_9STRA|nr:hypothetical protein PHYBOEH_001454 [Phytophthora boehmeriae]
MIPRSAIDRENSSSTELLTAEKQPLQSLCLLSKDSDNAALETKGTAKPADNSAVRPLHLDLDAHQRWNAVNAVKFLRTIDKIDIQGTTLHDDNVYFVVSVHVNPTATNQSPTQRKPSADLSSSQSKLKEASLPTIYQGERRFSDFEKLREDVNKSVSILPQCTCDYCTEFVLYIRYNLSQPRTIAKLVTTTKKRVTILTAFINDFVRMSQRRVEKKKGRRKCKAQELVPGLLQAFLTKQHK